MHEKWTDQEMDDFSRGVDQKFNRVDERFEALYRLLLQLVGYVIIALLVGLVITQL